MPTNPLLRRTEDEGKAWGDMSIEERNVERLASERSVVAGYTPEQRRRFMADARTMRARASSDDQAAAWDMRIKALGEVHGKKAGTCSGLGDLHKQLPSAEKPSAPTAPTTDPPRSARP